MYANPRIGQWPMVRCICSSYFHISMLQTWAIDFNLVLTRVASVSICTYVYFFIAYALVQVHMYDCIHWFLFSPHLHIYICTNVDSTLFHSFAQFVNLNDSFFVAEMNGNIYMNWTLKLAVPFWNGNSVDWVELVAKSAIGACHTI